MSLVQLDGTRFNKRRPFEYVIYNQPVKWSLQAFSRTNNMFKYVKCVNNGNNYFKLNTKIPYWW